jgi:hypothetical protein
VFAVLKGATNHVCCYVFRCKLTFRFLGTDNAAGGTKLPAISPHHRQSADNVLLGAAGSKYRAGGSHRYASMDGEEGKWTGPFRYLPPRSHEPSYYSALMARPFGPVDWEPSATHPEQLHCARR